MGSAGNVKKLNFMKVEVFVNYCKFFTKRTRAKCSTKLKQTLLQPRLFAKG